MEGVFVGLLILFMLSLLVLPLILAGVAMARASRALNRVREIEQRWTPAPVPPVSPEAAAERAPPRAGPVTIPPLPAPVSVETPPPAPHIPEAAAPPPLPAAAPPPERPPAPPAAPAESMELRIGGKIAGFIGIAALVLGVVFFVGYAIQHNWITPGLRIVLGLIMGAVLVVVGHALEGRGRHLGILARILTGGGASLFYFSVFAAHGIYELIGPAMTVIGLTAAAAATLALAVLFDSQLIGLLALFGAFVAPYLAGGDTEDGIFVLAFSAVVNLPVLALGLKRRWQALYNTAFVFTVATAAIVMVSEANGLGKDDWPARLLFSLLFFGEYAALGLIKIAREPEVRGRVPDSLRLILASLALLGAVYGIFHDAKLAAHLGAALLTGALLHLALAAIARRWRPEYRDEVLVLLLGALTFGSLALPAQLDGVWVSLGWAVVGVLVAWFAGHAGSSALRLAAFLVGLLGLGKSVFYDFTLYDADPRLFVNGRFAVSLLSALALGVQGRWAGRRDAGEAAAARDDRYLIAAVAAGMMAFVAEGLIVFGLESPWCGVIGTLALVGGGAMALLAGGREASRPLAVFALCVLAAAPAKLLLLDLTASWHAYGALPRFENLVFWSQAGLVSVALLTALSSDAAPYIGLRVAARCTAILGVVAVVTAELGRGSGAWSSSLITLWWAVAAIALAVVGLWRRRVYLRYLALAVFTAAAGKVFVVDLSVLHGLQRIAAFFGVGLLLLILSYAYLRLAPLLSAGRDAGKESP